MPDVIRVDGSGTIREPAETSTSALTLYVRSTGADTNDGLTTGTALLTIQAAIDKIPDILEHAISIDIGTGSFAGFILGHKSLNYNGNISITGAMKTATLATGTATGTSTGGSTTTLVHTGQVWTTNDLANRWVYVNSNLYVIASNTSDTLTLVGQAGTTMSGKAYDIQDNDTTLTSNVKLAGIHGGDNTLTIQKLKLATGANYGIYAQYIHCSFFPKYLYMEGATSAGIYVWFADYILASELSAKNCSYGYQMKDVAFVSGTFFSNGSTYNGFSLSGGNLSFLTGKFNSSSSSYGLAITNSVSSSVYNCGCASNAGGGVILDNATLSSPYTPITGTGNTGWGCKLTNHSVLKISNSNTVTGTLGELTIDDITPITWASFANVGDIAVNPNKLRQVERTA